MKKYYGVYIIIFSFIFMFLPISCTPASAVSESIVIPENLQELNLSSRLKFFLDKDNLIDEQILDKENEFVPLSETDQSGDLSDASYWLKADLTNQSEDTRNLLLEIQKPHLSSVTLYSIKNNQLIKEETLGYRFPFDTREYKHRNLVFELSLQPSASTTYLLKIQTDSFFQAPVSLWDPIAFSENNYTKQSIFGIFYGIMFAMIIYNSFLFISLKEKSYLYYILFIIGFTIMQTIWDGFAFQWLWGDFPWWALRSNSFFILWSSLFALQFARHFLQLKEKAPALNKAVTYFNSICAGCLLLPFILNVGTVTMISTVIATIFLVFIIAIALKVRLTTREAKFFIAAWTLLFAGVLLNLLAAYKILPLTNLTLYAPKIGAVVEVLVLSLGLADKIKRITKEKEQESRKYYIQTLLQNSFKQLSTIKEFKALTESGLTCLMDITQFEKGLYLMKEGTAWKCVSNAGNLEVKDHIEFESGSKEKYLYMKDVDETGNPFGLNHSSGSILAIPIHCDSHIGLFIVCSQQKEKLDSSVTGSLLSSFSDQFTALVDNINSFQALKKSAMFDHLTNLLNRKYFLEKVN
ncbi:hypothetical protein HP456_20490, partial [Bacillus haikouensis]|uniref:7TMR-DISM family protein n=1 Tax=Bacillus haikouensis TaxID=1510468 RepID=UPI001C12F6F7